MVERTRVELPVAVGLDFEVYVNGVRQREGQDFHCNGRFLEFDRELEPEGRLGFWRWLAMFLGVAGTYRRNDTVDIVYEVAGLKQVATGLPLRRIE